MIRAAAGIDFLGKQRAAGDGSRAGFLDTQK
jgi:hypothetical protein